MSEIKNVRERVTSVAGEIAESLVDFFGLKTHGEDEKDYTTVVRYAFRRMACYFLILPGFIFMMWYHFWSAAYSPLMALGLSAALSGAILLLDIFLWTSDPHTAKKTFLIRAGLILFTSLCLGMPTVSSYFAEDINRELDSQMDTKVQEIHEQARVQLDNRTQAAWTQELNQTYPSVEVRREESQRVSLEDAAVLVPLTDERKRLDAVITENEPQLTEEARGIVNGVRIENRKGEGAAFRAVDKVLKRAKAQRTQVEQEIAAYLAKIPADRKVTEQKKAELYQKFSQQREKEFARIMGTAKDSLTVPAICAQYTIPNCTAPKKQNGPSARLQALGTVLHKPENLVTAGIIFFVTVVFELLSLIFRLGAPAGVWNYYSVAAREAEAKKQAENAEQLTKKLEAQTQQEETAAKKKQERHYTLCYELAPVHLKLLKALDQYWCAVHKLCVPEGKAGWSAAVIRRKAHELWQTKVMPQLTAWRKIQLGFDLEEIKRPDWVSQGEKQALASLGIVPPWEITDDTLRKLGWRDPATVKPVSSNPPDKRNGNGGSKPLGFAVNDLSPKIDEPLVQAASVSDMAALLRSQCGEPWCINRHDRPSH